MTTKYPDLLFSELEAKLSNNNDERKALLERYESPYVSLTTTFFLVVLPASSRKPPQRDKNNANVYIMH